MIRSPASNLTSILRTLLHAVLCLMLLNLRQEALARPASCASESGVPQNIVTWTDIENAVAFRSNEKRPRTDSDAAPHEEQTDRPMTNDVRFDIGAAYLTGKRAAKDSTRAFAWFLSAAEHGDVEAAMIVAYLYANGSGTSVNCREAIKWLCQAGNSGIEEVKYAMGNRCSSATERNIVHLPVIEDSEK
ncbi:SEL1-like repeat protein [Caballeronia novacaledonica]|uniref:tetratricopeptide repeat protein n=1 Tax=Caballeronia novacaledonica TaxID=1544861 RepID=UPI001EE36055|nr:hypothetical protein [Caballeronia novacaledonica]GJH07181.1 SEL1-like repeat protein [Caballeronia novacaledonica]